MNQQKKYLKISIYWFSADHNTKYCENAAILNEQYLWDNIICVLKSYFFIEEKLLSECISFVLVESFHQLSFLFSLNKLFMKSWNKNILREAFFSHEWRNNKVRNFVLPEFKQKRDISRD